jgi:hypothetical protein
MRLSNVGTALISYARIGLMHKTCDVDVLFKEIYRKRLGFISVY